MGKKRRHNPRHDARDHAWGRGNRPGTSVYRCKPTAWSEVYGRCPSPR